MILAAKAHVIVVVTIVVFAPAAVDFHWVCFLSYFFIVMIVKVVDISWSSNKCSIAAME